jgi:hypothetical protein
MTTNQTDMIILIPVHRPKMNWLVSFLNSLALYDVPDHARIMLIASDRADFDYFVAALSYHPLSKHLMVLNAADWVASNYSSALLQRLQENAEGAIINLKKMIGLQWALQNGAQYALCLDSDVLAVAGLSQLYEIAKINHQKALYLGASIEGVENCDLLSRIIRETANLFAPDEQTTIAELTAGHTLYTWYGDLPVFAREDISAFFEYMQTVHGSMEGFLSSLRWATFDHMLYVFFRVSCRGAHIFDYRKKLRISALPEFLSPRELFIISMKTAYEVGWIGASNAYDHPEAFRLLPKLCLLSHFDRI